MAGTHTVSEAPYHRSPHEHGGRPQGKGFHDVGSATNSTVNENLATSAHGTHNLTKRRGQHSSV